MTVSAWDIPSLRSDRLATIIPTHVYGGGAISDPAHTLFLWRTAGLSTARDMTVGFYVYDERFEALWRYPEHYVDLFLHHGVAALIEPDFSLWTDMPLAEQLFNVYRMRTLARLWQEAGLSVIPNLAWSDARSFSFAFEGIPTHAPVVACEARTPGGNDDDRRRFLVGLAQAVKEVQPQNVIVYGGRGHEFWLHGHLPEGPAYTLLEAWTSARGKIRAAQERQERGKNQLALFTGGERWAVEAAIAAGRNAEAERIKDRLEARRAIREGTVSPLCHSQ